MRTARPATGTLAAAILALLFAGDPAAPAAPPPAPTGGIAVEGADRTRLLPPAGAPIEDYENAGYRLRVTDGEIRVDVDTSSLDSRSPFSPPAGTGSDPVSRLVRSLTAGAATRYDAVSRILAWVARSISYRLDRGSSQDAEQVLARREGYCTGIARLTVALLRAAGIEAREVAGYVADAGNGEAAGYHRWIEAYLPDRGWVFSDPLRSHHYVPATYVRLAGETLEPVEGIEGLLIERRDSLTEVDLFPLGTTGIPARRNSPRQLQAALSVRLEASSAGMAVLTGRSQRRSRPLVHGAAAFLGLEPGRYVLRLEVAAGVLERTVDLPDRVRRSISLPALSEHRIESPAPSTLVVGER